MTWNPGEKLQLAHHYKSGKVDLSLFAVSEKLDGCRAVWDGKHLYSKSGHVIETPPGFTDEFPKCSYPVFWDGELNAGRGTFDIMQSIIKRKDTAGDWSNVRFSAFDIFGVENDNGPMNFTDRYSVMALYPQSKHFRIVDHAFTVRTEEELLARLAEVEELGGEGLMLVRKDLPYTIGRSYNLQKVKRFHDAEALVVDHVVVEEGRNAGTVKSVVLYKEGPKDGVLFRIPTPSEVPPVGSTITYSYVTIQKNGVPRHAKFVRVREDE